jgi:NAD(P)H dehydrogenase (quinone)
MATVLVIGASGKVGSQVVKELDANHEGIARVRLATSRAETAEQWRQEGRQAVVLDLEDPQTLPAALDGVDRVSMVTGYTAAMLYQSKHLADAAAAAGVKFIVHLSVYTSGRDRIPHFAWHDMVESYIKASGLAWTNLHPNVILDSLLVTEPSIMEKRSFDVLWGEAALGWISAADIGSVAAAVLREGPEKHAGVDYGLSPEILTGPQAAAIITEATGVKVECNVRSSEYLAAYVASIPDAGARLYLESAVQAMRLGENGRIECQATVCNGFEEVMHRSATSLRDWALQNLATEKLKQ